MRHRLHSHGNPIAAGTSCAKRSVNTTTLPHTLTTYAFTTLMIIGQSRARSRPTVACKMLDQVRYKCPAFQASKLTLDKMSGVASSAVHPFQAQNNAFGRTRWEPSLRTRSRTNDCSLVIAECPDSARGAIHPGQPVRPHCHPHCAHSPELDVGWSTRRITRGVLGRAGKLGTPRSLPCLLGPASAFGRVSRCA